MKKYLIFAVVIIGLITTIGVLRSQLQSVKKERDVYISNTETLMRDVRRFETEDSLKAVAVGVLQLTIKEMEKYRAEDMEMIRKLNVKNRELDNITTMQMQTISELRGQFKDSIVYVDNFITDTLKCINIASVWFDMNGCIDKEWGFVGKHYNREKLSITAITEYKRFLGFLWYTNKVIDREVIGVSKNPDTNIIELEFVEVRKK